MSCVFLMFAFCPSVVCERVLLCQCFSTSCGVFISFSLRLCQIHFMYRNQAFVFPLSFFLFFLRCRFPVNTFQIFPVMLPCKCFPKNFSICQSVMKVLCFRANRWEWWVFWFLSFRSFSREEQLHDWNPNWKWTPPLGKNIDANCIAILSGFFPGYSSVRILLQTISYMLWRLFQLSAAVEDCPNNQWF